jgi:hypothetical protein
MTDTKASQSASGRFIVRIDPGLHAALRAHARRLGLSLNDYCARKLAAPAGDVAGPASDVVLRASSVFGDALVGVVAFGSWARDEQAADSDVDVLVVVAPTVHVTRETYRTWDEVSLRWGTHPVEAHFVRLPPVGAAITGLWAEAAVEGVVLFDRAHAVARRLVEIRRRIVGGEMIRRTTHGQPYWVRVS